MTCGSSALLLVVALRLGSVAVAAQTPAAAPGSQATSPAWQISGSWLARWESWSYFEPPPTGGDPRYSFLGNRARLELRGRHPRAELTLGAQYVVMAGLPESASNPGAFGTGALYYDQGGRRTNPQQIWLRYANVRLPGVARGLDVQIGRMPYTSGAEAPSGNAKIETVKRQRLDARVVGEFEWSIYQRGFDGVRVDVTRPAWKLTGLAAMPTQGGFARVAGPTITDIIVAGATISSRFPGATPRRTQIQGYGWYYADDRPVTQRPDNTGLSAARADIRLATVGGVLLGAYPAGSGEVDLFGWSALQTGDWYGQDHGAYAVALEGGYQWSRTPWRPWVRAGYFRASGDEDATDDRHGTFFPMLPTVRRFSQTTVYSTMNLNEGFVMLQARPRPSLGLRLDLHRVDLASAEDLWYTGSGATLGEGSVFGYTGRHSNGSTRLGTSVEASADYAVTPRVAVNAFFGTMAGAGVVTGTFQGDRLWYGYVESAITLTSR
jgi:Alginate export